MGWCVCVFVCVCVCVSLSLHLSEDVLVLGGMADESEEEVEG